MTVNKVSIKKPTTNSHAFFNSICRGVQTKFDVIQNLVRVYWLISTSKNYKINTYLVVKKYCRKIENKYNINLTLATVMQYKSPFDDYFYDKAPLLYIKRDRELGLLHAHFFDKGKNVVMISGRAGTGKTTLWSLFRATIKDIDFKVYYDSARETDLLANLNVNENEICVVEEFGYKSNKNEIAAVLKHYCDSKKCKIIFVTQLSDLLVPSPDILHIELSNLEPIQSKQLLELNGLNLNEADLNLLLQFSSGNVRLLRVIGLLIQENKYTINEIIGKISTDLHFSGILDPSGNLADKESPEYKRILNDIKIVNTDILYEAYLKPDIIYKLTSREFEVFVAELLARLGYKVELTKKTKDGEKDIIVAQSNELGSFLYYIECKRNSWDNPIGIRLVRELAGTVSADKVNAGIMVTSSYFSPDAIEFCKKIRSQISLIDYFRLQEWIQKAHKK